jgi:hypothetical protein
MNDMYKARSVIRNIKKRTWVILGGVVVVIVGFFIWMAFLLAASLWSQLTTGEGLAADALSRAEILLPGWREHAQQLAPELTAEALVLYEHAQRVAPELTKNAEKIITELPSTESAFPGANLASDVSGVDVGPVMRFPGLVRSAFLRNGETVQVDYQGKAALSEVVAHYTKGFEVAGFSHEVMRATAKSELHKFTHHASIVTVSVDRLWNDSLVVQITSSP